MEGSLNIQIEYAGKYVEAQLLISCKVSVGYCYDNAGKVFIDLKSKQIRQSWASKRNKEQWWLHEKQKASMVVCLCLNLSYQP